MRHSWRGDAGRFDPRQGTSPRAAHHDAMHYHYFTLEQRDALEAQIRARVASEPALQLALQRLHQPDYGVCIECGKDIAFVRLDADAGALHCGDCARLPIKCD